MTANATANIRIPQLELARTMKALVLERIFDWQRELNAATGEWRWRPAPVPGADGTPEWHEGWDALPNMLGDLDQLFPALGRMVAMHHEKKQTTAGIGFNPGDPRGPWTCEIADLPPPRTKVVARSMSNNLTIAVLHAMLTYYGIDPMPHHRTYFPGTYLAATGDRK